MNKTSIVRSFAAAALAFAGATASAQDTTYSQAFSCAETALNAVVPGGRIATLGSTMLAFQNVENGKNTVRIDAGETDTAFSVTAERNGVVSRYKIGRENIDGLVSLNTHDKNLTPAADKASKALAERLSGAWDNCMRPAIKVVQAAKFTN